MPKHNLPKYMDEWRKEIEKYAREFGLDFFPVIFQLMSYEEINQMAAYGGFPNRYPHWRFGMDYQQTKKGYTYGLQRIFEMVINNNPVYAYLLDCNNPVQQKSVMAHVYAHADFFKNNYAFAHTDRKMMDEMANHATRIRKYEDKYGIDEVENFIDTCLSLEYLIDVDALHLPEQRKTEEEEEQREPQAGKLKVGRQYMDGYINPKEELEKQKEKLKAEEARKRLKFPKEPEKDVLKFLSKHAPLKPWQKSILDIIREEIHYFAPQARTKILNEGWACFCHSRIMTRNIVGSSEIIDYADFHSQTASQHPGRLNPYALGLALLLDIEERWNKGRHGKEYEECEDMEKKRLWDTGEGKGLEKVFEARKFYTDVSFIDEFLTPEFCVKSKLFRFSKYHLKDWGDVWMIDSKQFNDVKEKLLFQLTNLGSPFVYITNANYLNRSELLLHHKWEGVPLNLEKAEDTLKNMERLWMRPVNLETLLDEGWHLMTSAFQEIDYNELNAEELSYKY